MKVLTNYFCLIFLMALSTNLSFAQPGSGQRGTPEERAERQTQMMKEKLSLSDAQAGKVKEVMLEYAQKMMDARASADGDFSQMRETMMTLRDEQNEEFKKYLTEDQYSQLLEIQAEQMQRRRNRMRNGQKQEGPRKKKDKTKS